MTAFTHTKVLYKVTEAMQLLSLGKTEIFEQIKAGRLFSVNQGRARRIPATAIDAYAALLEREARGEAA